MVYVASHDQVDWSKENTVPTARGRLAERAKSSSDAYMFSYFIPDLLLRKKILDGEAALMLSDAPPEAIKKELIDFLVENGYVETPAGSNIKEYVNV